MANMRPSILVVLALTPQEAAFCDMRIYLMVWEHLRFAAQQLHFEQYLSPMLRVSGECGDECLTPSDTSCMRALAPAERTLTPEHSPLIPLHVIIASAGVLHVVDIAKTWVC